MLLRTSVVSEEFPLFAEAGFALVLDRDSALVAPRVGGPGRVEVVRDGVVSGGRGVNEDVVLPELELVFQRGPDNPKLSRRRRNSNICYHLLDESPLCILQFYSHDCPLAPRPVFGGKERERNTSESLEIGSTRRSIRYPASGAAARALQRCRRQVRSSSGRLGGPESILRDAVITAARSRDGCVADDTEATRAVRRMREGRRKGEAMQKYIFSVYRAAAEVTLTGDRRVINTTGPICRFHCMNDTSQHHEEFILLVMDACGSVGF
ncbi:hypothetical protein EYF80_006356 [Liparis tanakae]|uniref:Uncharacterized protein n=1 Tax=Liparis tanakae TaxID=230148 RepID=A0A4Z2IZD1_9TELE|nr:hypothetical protein EYF80_006356 [Liparis tanakae]